MKKKLVAGIMSAMLVAGMVMPVSAAEGDTPTQTKEFSVEYEEPSTFILSIPASVTLKEDAEVSENIGLSDINVSTSEKVQIKVTSGISGGNVTLTDAADDTNTCTAKVSLMSGREGIDDNAVVAEFEGTSTTATTGGTLYFSQLGNVPAGTYRGQINFEASIVSKDASGATGE